MTVGRVRSYALPRRRGVKVVFAVVLGLSALATLASGCEIVAGIQDIELTGSTFGDGSAAGLGPPDGSYGVIGDSTAADANRPSTGDAGDGNASAGDAGDGNASAGDAGDGNASADDGAIVDSAIVDVDSSFLADGGESLDGSAPTDGADEGASSTDASEMGSTSDADQ